MLNPQNNLHKRYRIERLHELGAVETIYLGWDTISDTAVTISETRAQPNLQQDDLLNLKQQFMQKAQLLCNLNHPHLISPIDCFITDSQPIAMSQSLSNDENLPHSYIITPAIDFDSLLQLINEQGTLSEKYVVQWAEHVLQALSYSHKLGVIHGDIRPHNIFIKPEGDAILAHFEVPSLWHPSDPRKWTAKRVLGTPDYASPERWAMRVGQIDEKSDLYSLGATLFHALTGQVPLSAEERTANPYSFQDIQITNTNVSTQTKNVVTKAMAVPKDKRYPSAAAMAAALRTSTSRRSRDTKPAVPSLFPARNQKTFSMYKVVGLIVSSIVLFVAAVTGMWLNTIIPAVRIRPSPSPELPSPTLALAAFATSAEVVPPMPTSLPETLTPEVSPTIEIVEPVIAQTTVISDAFDSNTYRWPLSDSQDEWGSIIREVTAGVYAWKVGAEKDVGRWCLPDTDSYAANFRMSVDVKRLNGPPNIAYGLIVRHTEGRYYVFNARDDGFFRFSLWQGSEWITIVDWTQTLSIRSGENNHLEVIARNSEFEFYINDVYVGEAVDEEISAGDNGLSAIVLSNPEIASLEFDNFVLVSENLP